MAFNRTRHWGTIVYPESFPKNWQDLLATECVPAIISPLHDKDVEQDGTPKKPHWHVMLLFNGVKSQEQVHEICKRFGGVLPIPISNAQSMARYFIHKDNPDKYQYRSDDIVNLSGADWSELMKTSKDRYDTLVEIITYLHDNKVMYYHDLIDYCKDNNRAWYECAVDNTLVLKSYCLSASTKQKDMTDVSRLVPIPNRPVEHH